MIKVELESDGKGGNVLLSLFDIKRIIEKEIFTENFYDDLNNKVNENTTYEKIDKLKKVITDMGSANLEDNSFILAKSKVGNMDFGLLLEKQQVGGRIIQGIWPQDFYESIRDDTEIFQYFVYRLINTPEFFDNVKLYLPSQEALEIAKREKEKLKERAKKIPEAPAEAVPEAPTPSARKIPEPVSEPSEIPEPAATPSQPQTTTPMPKPSKVSGPPSPQVAPKSVVVDDKCPNCKATLSPPRLKILKSGQSTFCPKCLKIIHPPEKQTMTEEQEAKKIEYVCPHCGFPIPYTLLNEIHAGKKPKCVGCGKILDESVLE